LENNRKPFLACYDYGQGGLWGVILADTAEEITTRYPHLIVFADRPSWMDKEEYERIRADICFDVGEPSPVSYFPPPEGTD
jgi:hypothetical protein